MHQGKFNLGLSRLQENRKQTDLATALMVAGEDGAKFFSQPELVGYEVFVIGRHENSAWSI